jgi:hypothetical protein
MIIAWNNQISNYNLSATSEDTLYPIDNITDIRLSKIWKATSIATQTIIIDCVSSASLGVIAILGHNLTGATIKLQGNRSADFTTPAFSYTFSSAEIDDVIYYISDNTVAYRYWAIKIENAVFIPYIGHVFFDIRDFIIDQLTTNITPVDFEDASVYIRNEIGSLYGYKNEIILKSFQIVFEDISYVEYDALMVFLEHVGKVLPFIILWNVEDVIPGIKNLYCHLKENFKILKIAGQNRFDYNLIVEEIK